MAITPKSKKPYVPESVEIICPDCDGNGDSIIASQEGGVPISCSECQGTGKIKVVK